VLLAGALGFSRSLGASEAFWEFSFSLGSFVFSGAFCGSSASFFFSSAFFFLWSKYLWMYFDASLPEVAAR
jgi:hypothetical protein